MSSARPPARPNSSANIVKMKSVCFSGRKSRCALGAGHEALAKDAAGADRDLRLEAVIAGAERIAFGIEEGADARALIVVQMAPHQRPGAAARRVDGREDPPSTPARKKIAAPVSTSIKAVPRSGCFSSSAAGNSTSEAATDQDCGRPMRSSPMAWK